MDGKAGCSAKKKKRAVAGGNLSDLREKGGIHQKGVQEKGRRNAPNRITLKKKSHRVLGVSRSWKGGYKVRLQGYNGIE